MDRNTLIRFDNEILFYTKKELIINSGFFVSETKISPRNGEMVIYVYYLSIYVHTYSHIHVYTFIHMYLVSH